MEYDLDCLKQMMWALEYDPDLYTLYEEFNSDRPEDAKGKRKSSRQCGKYEREYLRSGAKNGEPLPIFVFLVASVLKEKSVKLLTEAKGLDDVVKILNDTLGNLDARKSCSGVMKLHKKYSKKVHVMPLCLNSIVSFLGFLRSQCGWVV
ncbi:hypothetical protein HanOQP8_Chr12g0439451 [Helianthus annuus]|nr:hypothetical protein HanOQP8_Chr12g0439451 [Helianthus annuus]